MKEEKYLIIPFLTLIICQLIKFVIESIRDKKLKWSRLFNGTGGMPSSHTSFCFSLTTIIGLNEGVSSSLFAVCLVFSLIIAYDAMGFRMESGKQAMTINIILDEIFEGKPKEGILHLKEQLGHQPLEVMVGLILGVLTSLIGNLL